MQVEQSIHIDAKPAAVWAIISDMEHCQDNISGIDDAKVLEQATGPSLVGLKWQETRTMFGKAATETMWITDAKDSEFYQTRAESNGSVYVSRMEIEPADGGSKLTMSFQGTPETTGAKILWFLTGWMAKKPLLKVMAQDLQDIKAASE